MEVFLVGRLLARRVLIWTFLADPGFLAEPPRRSGGDFMGR
jgi:hypothetical protein